MCDLKLNYRYRAIGVGVLIIFDVYLYKDTEDFYKIYNKKGDYIGGFPFLPDRVVSVCDCHVN